MILENVVTWTLVGGVILFFLLPYIRQTKKNAQLSLETKERSKQMGDDIPTVQHPLINPSLCIGCGTCVRKCPEGTILGLVGGKSTIINGANCKGHGRCEASCPVGAITIGLGDTSKRSDIPILDENQQTSIEGIYIAGELGGYALIRNAVNQGKTIIKQLKPDATLSKQPDLFDVIIIGGGPAGISAALGAKEKKFSYLLIDQQAIGGTVRQYPREKLVLTDLVELPLYGKLTKSEYTKEELIQTWETIHKKFKIHSLLTKKLFNVVRQDESTFDVRVTDINDPKNIGRYKAQNVILALGRRGNEIALLKKIGIQFGSED